jgi:signal transduction histidine kinase
MLSKSRRVLLYEKPSVFPVALFMSFVVVFGVASIIAYNSYIKTAKNTIRSNEIKANLLAKLILEHQRAAIGVLQSYASRRLLVDSVKRKNFERAVEHLANLAKNNPEMEWPFISDPDSPIWVNFPVDRSVMNKDLSQRDWYKGVSREWKPYVSSVYKMIVGKQDLAVAVSTPIFDEKGKVIGILSTAQTTAFFQKIISEIGADLKTKISLIDQDGHIIYSNRFPYKREVIGYPSFEFVRKAMKEEKGGVEIRDSSDGDKTKYVSFEPIEGIGWSVIVEIGKKEVLRSELAYLILIGATSLLIYIVVALFLVYLRERYKQLVGLKTLTEELTITNKRCRIEIDERKRTEDALRETQKQLRFFSAQRLTAQEQERKRIAGEIHDGIGSTLGAIKFKVENTTQEMEQGAATSQSLKDLIPMLQEAIEESRRLQMDLRPSILDDLGISPALSWFCRRFQTLYSGIRIEQKIDIQENEISDTLKTSIYRIFQEGLNNIAKHSKGDLVSLSLQKTDTSIELIVEDNGQGFDVKEVLSTESYKRGLGLSSMRERTELSGGSFTIESIKGKGTVIRASWPIKQSSS